MKDLIFFTVGSIITLLFLWRAFSLLGSAFIQFKSMKIMLGKKHLLGLGGGGALIMILIAVIAWQNTSFNQRAFVRMDGLDYDNIYIAEGRVQKVVFDNWNVKSHYGQLVKAGWRSGETLIFNTKSKLVSCIKHKSAGDSLMLEKDYLERFREEMTYSDKGHMSSTHYFNDEGELYSIYNNDFDQWGYPNYGIKYNSKDGKSTSSNHYEFDKEAKSLIQRYFVSGNLKSKEQIFFWNRDIPKKKILFGIEDGKEVLWAQHEYDQRGLTISVKSYYTVEGETTLWSTEKYNRDHKGHIKSYEYEEGGIQNKPEYLDFDAKGNWTRLIVFKNGYPEMMITRKITYYD